MADRLQQSDSELSKLIQVAERLKHDLPRSQYDQLQRTIEQRQEELRSLQRTCQQARDEHEQKVKTQNKLVEELQIMHEWFKRLLSDWTQPLDLNFSLNNVRDLQESMTVSSMIVRK